MQPKLFPRAEHRYSLLTGLRGPARDVNPSSSTVRCTLGGLRKPRFPVCVCGLPPLVPMLVVPGGPWARARGESNPGGGNGEGPSRPRFHKLSVGSWQERAGGGWATSCDPVGPAEALPVFLPHTRLTPAFARDCGAQSSL